MSMVGSRPGSAGAGSGGSAASSGGGGGGVGSLGGMGGGMGSGLVSGLCMSGGSCSGGMGADAISLVSSVLPQSEMCGLSGAGSSLGGGPMGSMMGGINYLDCMQHYERMPLPVPLTIVQPPPPLSGSSMMMHHSEDEVEPAYATGMRTAWWRTHCVD